MSDLIPFTYGDRPVRVVTIDGEPWFVLADLCKVLGLARSASAISERLDDGVRQTYPIADSLGRTQSATVVSEAGMYEVVIRSDKPEAIAFRRWITGEVLPTIRKTGTYSVQPELSREELLARAVLESAEVIKEREARIAELEPPARAWKHMVAADGTYSVGDAAKTLSADPSISIGQNRLFKFMAEQGWIYRAGQRDREAWRVYQPQIENGRLVEKLNRPFLNERTGEYESTAPTVRITPKGVDELHKRLTAHLRLVTA